jgi:hypothetical protein
MHFEQCGGDGDIKWRIDTWKTLQSRQRFSTGRHIVDNEQIKSFAAEYDRQTARSVVEAAHLMLAVLLVGIDLPAYKALELRRTSLERADFGRLSDATSRRFPGRTPRAFSALAISASLVLARRSSHGFVVQWECDRAR